MEALTRAPFTFFSNRLYDPALRAPDDLERLRRFQVCLSNGYETFEGAERDAFLRAGCELFVYLWFDGFYQKEADPAHPLMRTYPGMAPLFTALNRPEFLLNPGNPLQGNGAVQPAFFYDFGNPAFRRTFIEAIRARLRATGYRGVFFDYIGGWALPKEVVALWEARHPTLSRDEAGATFLRGLRRAIPGIRIFGNQTYRLPAVYDDTIDFDLTESHATSFVWGKETELEIAGKGRQKITETFYRPWDGASGYRAISQARRERQARRPRTRVFDLNYLQPRYLRESGSREFVPTTDRPAIFYGYVLAKLTGTDASASDWYCPGFGRDEIYFADLGRPREETYTEEENVVTRYFARGVAVATRQAAPARFCPDPRRMPRGVRALRDLYDGTSAPASPDGIAISPEPYPATGSSYPSGRVFLYQT